MRWYTYLVVWIVLSVVGGLVWGRLVKAHTN